ALIKYLQNLWLFLSAVNLTGSTTRLSFDETITRVQHYYAFHEEASLRKQLDEIRQWVQQYGKSVGQNTTRNFSTKDKPGTLPLNLYESAPPEQPSVDFDVLHNEDIPVHHQDTNTARNIVIAQSTYVVVSRIYKPSSALNSPLYLTKLLKDVVDDYDSARYETTLFYTQDVVDPLLFTTSGEEHVIPKEGIKGVVSSITVVDNETVEIDEEEYYLLLAL
ncbi:unnamed protein product, partial [Porites lobata]